MQPRLQGESLGWHETPSRLVVQNPVDHPEQASNLAVIWMAPLWNHSVVLASTDKNGYGLLSGYLVWIASQFLDLRINRRQYYIDTELLHAIRRMLGDVLKL